MSHEILSSGQMAEAEQAAIKGKVTGFVLMQRAGKAVVEEILSRYSKQPVFVLCGSGKNGGDGFVIASLLKKKNWPVTLACAVDSHDLQGDASRAAELWTGDVIAFDDVVMPESGLIVDAIFGSGLSRPIIGKTYDILMSLRESSCPVIAVDVPSGVYCDGGECEECTPQADLTVTFFRKKPAHVLLPAREACGDIVVADIGLTEDSLENIGPFMLENAPDLSWGQAEFQKPLQAHKYHHGHCVVLGGRVMTGAASLAAMSALRMGAGLVTIVTPADTTPLYQLQNPSLMVEPLTELVRFKDHIKDTRRNGVVIGCGLGQDNPAILKKIIFDVVQSSPQKICVLDADALTVFAEDSRPLLSALHGQCVLTPHEGEFEKLFPDIRGSKIERAYTAAKRTKSIVVLKGADTVIAAPDDRLVINVAQTGWLATAGSGDVLAGMIAGLAVRGVTDLFDSVCAAVWMHAKAGDSLGAGMISSDIPSKIPAIWQEILAATDEE
jgi:hydroxyethylthiazole kinase-like uncharacterized protein yjeF